MINFEELGDVIFQAAVRALGEGANLVADRARHLAPVRHVFGDQRYTIRFKRAAEIEADRAVRAQLGLSPEGTIHNPRPRTIRAKSPLRRTEPGSRWADRYGSRPQPRWRERRMRVAQQHLADYEAEMASRKAGFPPQPTVLDRRGAHEVRSKRAASLRWGHAYIGGRLRNSIRAIPPDVTGSQASAWVTAGDDEVHYAKYMEFGTRHAAAHPFLRPALAESKEELINQIATAVKEASKNAGSSTEIEINVRI